MGGGAAVRSTTAQELRVLGDSFTEQLSRLDNEVAGGRDVLDLPIDWPRQSLETERRAIQTRKIPASLLETLGSLAEREHSAVPEVLFSGFQALLHRYTGSREIVTGTPVPGQAPGTLLGLRTDVSGDPPFRQLLAQVRETLRKPRALTRLGAPGPGPPDGSDPGYQVTFQCGEQAQFKTGLDLNMEVKLGAHDPHCVLDYSPDLFEAETIHRMLVHYQTILEAVAENPGERVSLLPILTEAERRRVLVEWNDTQADYPRTCVHRLFEEQVLRSPDAIALIYEDRQLTYAELNVAANRLAHALRSLGVGPNVLVGLCIERSMEMVVALLAILKAGGAYAVLDPVYPKERLAFMLDDLRTPVLLCRNRAVTDGMASFGGTVLPVDEWQKITVNQSPENPASEVEPENLAYVLYTSGSTGQPKGVLIPHRALVNYLAWCTVAYGADLGRGSPVHTPLGFDLTVTSLFPPLLTGRSAVLVREDPSLEALTAALREGDFSLVKLTPAHLEALSHKLGPEQAGMLARTFVIGGEALLGEALGYWRKQDPDVRLINEYGPTEATVGCCVYEVPTGLIPASAVPIGRPIANVRVYVLDRNLQPVPIGVPGELYIAGAGLALGYHRRPELTAERFVRDPFSSERDARMYKTGDLVRYRPDGNLVFLGRLDHQVKIRGFRIELTEIEAALVGHPGIGEATVIASEARHGDRRLVAYVVRRQATLTELEVRAFLKSRLPDYMLPARYVFLESLPLTSNGKVDRRALSLFGLHDEIRAERLDAPRDSLEVQLVKLWEEVLHAKPIGIQEDFFDLGGNSLLAIRMLARVEKLVNAKITLATLMFAPTIEKLASMLRDRNSLKRPQVFAIQPDGFRPPFFCVGAGPLFRSLASALGVDQPFLGVPLPDINALPAPYCLEDIAAYCVQTLLQVQPEGPYFLGGWSDAGVMAYEMAQQLRQRGESVALVVLFDAENQAKRSDAPSSLASIRMRAHFLSQWVRLQFRSLWSFEPRERAAHLRRRVGFRLAWLKGLVWGLAYRIHLRAGWSFHHGLHNIEYVSVFASKNYQPRQYDGRVLLFRRADRPTGQGLDLEYGWGGLATGLEIYEVPGNHIDMFLEPNVHEMAGKLRKCLLEAQESSQVKAAGANQR